MCWGEFLMAMKVKIFDEEHEKDLENSVNVFLAELLIESLIDIKYEISHFSDGPGQIFSYSAMVIYRD